MNGKLLPTLKRFMLLKPNQQGAYKPGFGVHKVWPEV